MFVRNEGRSKCRDSFITHRSYRLLRIHLQNPMLGSRNHRLLSRSGIQSGKRKGDPVANAMRDDVAPSEFSMLRARQR